MNKVDKFQIAAENTIDVEKSALSLLILNDAKIDHPGLFLILFEVCKDRQHPLDILGTEKIPEDLPFPAWNVGLNMSTHAYLVRAVVNSWDYVEKYWPVCTKHLSAIKPIDSVDDAYSEFFKKPA